MKVLIMGASARAASQSAHRDGHEVIAADLFADRDLKAVATCFQVADYPGGFLEIRERFASLPVIYTGALENHPTLLQQFVTQGPVFGNYGDTLLAVRDPIRLTKALGGRGLPFAETTMTPPATAAANAWLVKLRSSAGGMHVRPWISKMPTPDQEHVFQRRLTGVPCSAAFVMSPTCNAVRFLGASRMLVGPEWGGPSEFAYCGSEALNVTSRQEIEWTAIGQAIGDSFELRGVFGVDAIATADGIVPIEVNPRYTASMEVVEPALSRSIVSYHLASCLGDDIPQPHRKVTPAAKLIVYAKNRYIVPATLADPKHLGSRWADIPSFGQVVEPGQPLLTVLANSPDEAVKAAGELTGQ